MKIKKPKKHNETTLDLFDCLCYLEQDYPGIKDFLWKEYFCEEVSGNDSGYLFSLEKDEFDFFPLCDDCNGECKCGFNEKQEKVKEYIRILIKEFNVQDGINFWVS